MIGRPICCKEIHTLLILPDKRWSYFQRLFVSAILALFFCLVYHAQSGYYKSSRKKKEQQTVKNFNYYAPTEIVFGCGRIKEVGKIVKKYGKKALLVTESIIRGRCRKGNTASRKYEFR